MITILRKFDTKRYNTRCSSTYQIEYLIFYFYSSSLDSFIFLLLGDSCWQSDQPVLSGFIDRFEDINRPSVMWDRIFGGGLGSGCGDIGGGNSLYFDGLGVREARTVLLDTRNIK